MKEEEEPSLKKRVNNNITEPVIGLMYTTIDYIEVCILMDRLHHAHVVFVVPLFGFFLLCVYHNFIVFTFSSD